MKVLIISLPRTGSVSLLNLIGDSLGLKKFDEPFNPAKSDIRINEYIKELKNETNLVVKDILYYRPKSVSKERYYNWLEDYSQNFDKLIFLSRKSEIDHKESFINLIYQNKRYLSDTSLLSYPWNAKYKYEDIPQQEIDSIKNLPMVEDFIRNRAEIKDICKKFGKEILWYEDIFDNPLWENVLSNYIPELRGLNLNDYLTTQRYRIKSQKNII